MVRIDEEMWTAYGQLCDEEGTSRADDIRRHVHSRVNAWRHKTARIEAIKRRSARLADDENAARNASD